MTRLILVVDDDDRSRKLAADLLRHHGHTVVALADGEAALDYLGSTRPDLVLLDLQLPGCSGLDVLAWIQRQPALQAMPVLAMTASVMPSQHGDLAQRGFAAFLGKPLSIKGLAATVQACLPQGPP
ncbi:MAG TPA: response regulator [Ideonella sp.]|nr:response regulator [Ideonella sp.]